MYRSYLDSAFMAMQDFELEFQQKWATDHPMDDREIEFTWDQQIDDCAECGCDRLLGEWFERDNIKPGDYWADPDSVQLQPPDDQQLGTLEFEADLFWTCEDCLRRIMEDHKNRDNHGNDDGED